jgi:hypothetical protein
LPSPPVAFISFHFFSFISPGGGWLKLLNERYMARELSQPLVIFV